MKVGDLVRVKDAMGYSGYMQNLAGHTGVIIEQKHTSKERVLFKLHISELSDNFLCVPSDLEVISESR